MPVLPDYFLYHIVNYIIYSLPIWGIKGVWLFNIIKAVKLLMFKFPVELVNLFLLLCINTILILGLIKKTNKNKKKEKKDKGYTLVGMCRKGNPSALLVGM